MGMFFFMNNVALPLRIPILFVLTSGLGVHYLVSNLLSLLALTVLRFAIADSLDLGQVGAGGSRRSTRTTSTASPRSLPTRGSPSSSAS